MSVPAFPLGWKAGILVYYRTKLMGLIPDIIKLYSLMLVCKTRKDEEYAFKLIQAIMERLILHYTQPKQRT